MVKKKESIHFISIERDTSNQDDRREEQKKAPLSLSMDRDDGLSTKGSQDFPGDLQDKNDVYKALENLKLQHVMGLLEEEEFRGKREQLEQLIEKYDTQELDAADAPPVHTGEEADEEEQQESEDSESQKILKLLDSLEERFIMGEINEETYRDLKAKYQRTLSALKHPQS